MSLGATLSPGQEPVAGAGEHPITVIGVPADRGPAAIAGFDRAALAEADVVAAAGHFLDELARPEQATIEIGADVPAALDAIAAARQGGGRVVVLASGDPGFFGIGRVLAERFGPASLKVHAAVSSVAAAFARLGLPWDDAVVVSAHGRPLEAAVGALVGGTKAAVLTSPENPPERIGAELASRGARFDRVIVASDLGFPAERIHEGTGLDWLAAGSFPGRSVVVLLVGSGVGPLAAVGAGPSLRAAPFGRDEDAYEHRGGMITKAEVRAVVLARLELPPSGVLWDVGAGSGSVGIEAATLSPGMQVIAVERTSEDAERIRRNSARHGVAVEVVQAPAPAALAGLPRPDRAFVGGGGLPVLDAVLDLLAPAGRVVATFASLQRAVAAAERLGNLVQLSVSRGERLPDSTMRLAPLTPVFVCWGPA